MIGLSESVVQATMRLTVVGAAGRADLAVPIWTELADVQRRYVDAVGDRADVLLASTTGALLDPARPVQELGLRHGDVLVAMTAESRSAPTGPEPDDRPLPQDPRLAAVRAALALVATGCAVVAGTTAALLSEGPVAIVAVAALLAGALVAQLPIDRAQGDARVRSSAAPAFAAAAGFAVAYSTEPGGVLLGISVAAIAATAVAGMARAFAPPGQDEYLMVWLWVAGSVAVVAATFLLFGVTSDALWPVLLAGGVIAARLLPAMVVDVPDQVLLDLDRLAITAWSARERPRGSRRKRSVIRPDAVAEVARRGRRLVAGGSVAVAVAVVSGGALMLISVEGGLQGIGSRVLVFFGGAGLALMARAYRARLPQLLLRLAAATVVLGVAVDLLVDSGAPVGWTVVGASVAVGLLTALTAVALGRGWRSIWWARVADITEGLCTVLVLAALPVATGLFDTVRQFAS